MKTIALMGFTSFVAAAMVLGVGARTAHSRPNYKAQFVAKYLKPDGTADEKAYAELVAKTNCQVCHEPGMNRKLRNAYGKELAKLFDPPKETDKKKIDDVLDKVAAMHIDEKDPKSPTYGDLIKQHKLPVEPKPEEKK